MKKILNKLTILALALVVFASCEVNEKIPFPIPEDGSFVTVEFDNLILDVQDLANSSINGTLKAPVANVASYSLEVSRTSGGVTSAYAPVYSASSFPDNFNITPEAIATALGLTTADLNAGDRFDFQGVSTSTDGKITDWSVLNNNLQAEPAQLQSYQFTSFISCPFVQADAIGTYAVTVSGFAGYPIGNTFEIIAGENANQIIMVNPHGSVLGSELPAEAAGYKVVIDVTPFGIATVEDTIDDIPQYIFDTDGTGNGGFFDTNVDGGGFVFSCTGSVILTLGYDLTQVSSGSNFTFGGAIGFSAQKQ